MAEIADHNAPGGESDLIGHPRIYDTMVCARSCMGRAQLAFLTRNGCAPIGIAGHKFSYFMWTSIAQFFSPIFTKNFKSVLSGCDGV